MRSSTCGQIDVRRSSPAAEPLTSPVVCPSSAEVLDRDDDLELDRLGRRRLHDLDVVGAAEEPGDLLDRADGRGQADALGRLLEQVRRAARATSARWAPRLVPATAWTSSTITVSTPRSDSRAWQVRIRNSDSGVVMRMSGGVRPNRRRSSAGVSPERTPTVRSGSGRPSRVAACRMPASGARRLRSTSTASAFIGLT